ncbi:hypothetical protein EYF80_033757 [Liparis tanakae]|uniref:Uncharacterized protein n=1 Tax=Liparis tanakae TaxID=230148 RepID=A0A4Z2GRW2_9TELE|nr:hypothetical protein EYF80_033757 [Liparis tanakae]
MWRLPRDCTGRGVRVERLSETEEWDAGAMSRGEDLQGPSPALRGRRVSRFVASATRGRAQQTCRHVPAGEAQVEKGRKRKNTGY